LPRGNPKVVDDKGSAREQTRDAELTKLYAKMGQLGPITGRRPQYLGYSKAIPQSIGTRQRAYSELASEICTGR